MAKNVILIGDAKSFMVTAIAKELTASGYEGHQVGTTVDELSRYKSEDGVFLLYLDSPEEMKEGIVYLRDQVMDSYMSLVVIGKHLELQKLYETIPEDKLSGTFMRPVNIKELGDQIDEIQNEESRRKNKKKILIVDDDGTMLRTMKSWLSEKYQVYMVNSGMAAITFLTKNQVDLILLDYEMPITSGPQVLEMLRTDPDMKSIPVMFLTIKADKHSVLTGLSLKPESYLLKTMPKKDLLKNIDDFFMKQRMGELGT